MAGDTFHFPREENNRLGHTTSKDMFPLVDIPPIDEIMITLERAKYDALNDALKLGMVFESPEIAEQKLIEILINPVHCDEIPNSDDESIEETKICEEPEFSGSDVEIDEGDLSLFSSYKKLNLKDYSEDKVTNKGSFLNVTLNGKKHLIKKSSLCWLLSDKSRLSNDRIYRVRGMTSLKKKIK